MNTPKVILLIESSRAYGRGLLRGIAKYARLHGPWSFYSEPGGLERSLPKLQTWGANGIIARASIKSAEALRKTGLPAIAIGLDTEEIPGLPKVNADNIKAGQMGADHLLKRGFKNFAYLGFEQWQWSRKRGASFARKIAEAGFQVQFYERPASRGRVSYETEQAGISAWLGSLPKPVALMACNDDRARHAIEACNAAGIHVPDEVAVLGVDDDEVVCGLNSPQISSISLNTGRGGYEAAELLDRLMAGEKMKQQEVIVHPVRVITRQSTDIYAVEDRDMAEVLRYIREHAKESVQVGEIADSTAISRRSLELRFRKVFGRSVHDEIRRIRVEQIVRMLVETNLPITRIASELGYPSAKHISRYFRKEKGISPIAWRRLHGQK